jgi:hypothetical protein
MYQRGWRCKRAEGVARAAAALPHLAVRGRSNMLSDLQAISSTLIDGLFRETRVIRATNGLETKLCQHSS